MAFQPHIYYFEHGAISFVARLTCLIHTTRYPGCRTSVFPQVHNDEQLTLLCPATCDRYTGAVVVAHRFPRTSSPASSVSEPSSATFNGPLSDNIRPLLEWIPCGETGMTNLPPGLATERKSLKAWYVKFCWPRSIPTVRPADDLLTGYAVNRYLVHQASSTSDFILPCGPCQSLSSTSRAPHSVATNLSPSITDTMLLQH